MVGSMHLLRKFNDSEFVACHTAGMTRAEAAKQLCVSVETIKVHAWRLGLVFRKPPHPNLKAFPVQHDDTVRSWADGNISLNDAMAAIKLGPGVIRRRAKELGLTIKDAKGKKIQLRKAAGTHYGGCGGAYVPDRGMHDTLRTQQVERVVAPHEIKFHRSKYAGMFLDVTKRIESHRNVPLGACVTAEVLGGRA